MTVFETLDVTQLERALVVRKQIESLKSEMTRILGNESPLSNKGKWTMPPSARAKIAAAQKARWAKLKKEKPNDQPKRKMSAKARAAIAAAARARWKKAKAAGKNTL
jgi:hypothetical protein